MKNNKRFEGRKTTVKGFIVNVEEMTKREFECEIEYTRSADKATEKVKQVLNLAENDMVLVKEVINERIKPVKYNLSKVMQEAYNTSYDEEEAKALAVIDGTNGTNVVKCFEYHYEGQVWAREDNGEYFTKAYQDVSPLNMTKVDARAFFRMSFEDWHNGCKVIGVHDVKKTEKPIWCLITEEKLQMCIES